MSYESMSSVIVLSAITYIVSNCSDEIKIFTWFRKSWRNVERIGGDSASRGEARGDALYAWNFCHSFSELSAFFILTGSEIFPQGILLSWTKKFKARGVQGTDVVSCLTKAIRKHKVRGSPPVITPFSPGGVSYCVCPRRRIREEIDLGAGVIVV